MTNFEWLQNHKTELARRLVDWSDRYESWYAKIGPPDTATLCADHEEAVQITLNWLNTEVENDKS